MDYRDLDSLIDRLDEQVHESDPRKGYWKELWALARKIGDGFKDIRYEKREEKDEAWRRFQMLCEKARERGNANRREMNKRQSEWEQRKSKSEQTRMGIEGRAAGARPL